jgi:hypothetical protein
MIDLVGGLVEKWVGANPEFSSTSTRSLTKHNKLSTVGKSTELPCSNKRRVVDGRQRTEIANNKKEPILATFNDLRSTIFSQNIFKKCINTAEDS